MPELGKLTQVSQGSVHISSVTGGTVRPAKIEVAHVYFPSESYAGPYEFTPSDAAQTVIIAGMVAERNIVISPIPSNYGRIAWDGITLTIS